MIPFATWDINTIYFDFTSLMKYLAQQYFSGHCSDHVYPSLVVIGAELKEEICVWHIGTQTDTVFAHLFDKPWLTSVSGLKMKVTLGFWSHCRVRTVASSLFYGINSYVEYIQHMMGDVPCAILRTRCESHIQHIMCRHAPFLGWTVKVTWVICSFSMPTFSFDLHWFR